MSRGRLTYLILCLPLLLPAVSWADDGGTESVFNLGAGARAMGMGNGYVALAEDATAVYYNPAGMPYLWSQQISFLHTVLFEGTVYDYIAYVYPYSSIGAFGFAGMRLGTDDIGHRDAFTDLGRFSATHMQLLLSYSRRFGDDISAGLNLKLAHQSIYDYSDYGFGFDLAGRYMITERLRAGILLQNLIGARMKLIDDRERTPFTFRSGVAYLYELPDLPLSGAVTFDIEKPEKRDIKVRTGFELAHTSGLAIRAGFDRDNASLGLGIRYQQLSFDYAYKFIDHLMDSHRISLSFDFGPTRDEIERRRAAERHGDLNEYLRENRREALRRELERADRFLKDDQLDSALAAYFRADAFADRDAREKIRNRIIEVKDLLALREKPVEPEPVEILVTDDAGVVARRATSLLEKNALLAARDLLSNARSHGIDSEELRELEKEVGTRIEAHIRATLRSGDQAFNQDDYIEAYNKYREVLAYDNRNLRARDGSRAAKYQIDLAQHLKLAMDYFDQKRYVLSQREFNAVLQLDPRNETALEYLQRIDQVMKDTATPEDHDLRQDAEMWQTYLDGVEAYRAGDFQRAIELWEEVLKKYPNNRMTLENIRQARLRLRGQ